MLRIVTAALAALVVALTLSSGARHTTQTPARPFATCADGTQAIDTTHGTTGQCGDRDGADHVVATASGLSGQTSSAQSDVSLSRVAPATANRHRALPALATARAHDPSHLHAYSLLI